MIVDTKAALAGLDDSAISAAADAAKTAGHPGKYALLLQLPTSQGVLSSLQDRSTRQRVFEASTTRCMRGNTNDNREAVLRMKESAHAQGFRAIIGMRLETAQVAASRQGGTAGVEVIAWGTALKLARE